MRRSLRFLVPLALTLAAIAYAVVPLVDELTLRWFVRDLDIRAHLVASAVEEPLVDLLTDRTRDRVRVQRVHALLTRVIKDERLFAMGYCDASGALLYRTELLPPEVRCPGGPEAAWAAGRLVTQRGGMHVHTFSSVMCWVACDRLAKIATRVGLEDRARHWRAQADVIHQTICARAWSEERRSFVSTFGGDALDASLLLLAELGFLRAADPRFAATVAAVERDLRRGDFVYRYQEADDFGVPKNAFVVCTFWYIEALVMLGRREEARSLFEAMLARRNCHGLLSEHIDPSSGELWGNFPQTYSMVGLINAATRLSIPWEQGF